MEKRLRMEVVIADSPYATQDLDNLASVYNKLGCKVRRIPTGSPDAMFLRDTFAWTPKGLIRCNMKNPERQGEPSIVLSRLRETPKFKARQVFEGADLLFLDNSTALLGRGQRTPGTAEIEKVIKSQGVEVYTVALSDWHDQHLLGLCNATTGIDGEITLWCHYSLTPQLSKLPYRIFELPGEECLQAKGSNWVQIGARVVLNETCTVTASQITRYCPGLQVEPVGIAGLLRYGGGVACATGILEP